MYFLIFSHLKKRKFKFVDEELSFLMDRQLLMLRMLKIFFITLQK